MNLQYLLSFRKGFERQGCFCSSVPVINENEEHYVILSHDEYHKFSELEGDKYPFTLPNNHLLCPTCEESIFVVWIFNNAVSQVTGSLVVMENSLSQSVLKWLDTSA